MAYTKQRKVIPECNIDPDLWAAWKTLKRRGDPDLIKAHDPEKKLSKPVIIDAIKYGHVRKQRTLDIINSFFRTRMREEKLTINALLNGEPVTGPNADQGN